MNILSINFLLLTATILLSVLRNLFSRKLSQIPFPGRSFFLLQAAIFLAGGTVIFFTVSPRKAGVGTICIALCYAVFLLLAQWCYTAALSQMKLSVCSTVYSLGFIIPTLAGSFFWQEGFTISDLLGTLSVAAAILMTGRGSASSDPKVHDQKGYLLLLTAMLSSGALGLIQKIQQSIPGVRDERAAFVVIAFAAAAAVSLAASLLSGSGAKDIHRNHFLFAILTGAAFGACNLLNTTLAGRLKSSVLFPVLNISVILLSAILGRILTREKFGRKELTIFLLGAAAILFLSLG